MKDICFDLYGTLLDIRTDEESPRFWAKIASVLKSERSGAWLASLYHATCAEEQEGQGKQELDLLPVFETMLQRCAPRFEGGATAFARAFRHASVITCRPFAGVSEMLNELNARGARLYLLSNAQACFTRAELTESGLGGFFRGIMLSSEIGWKKPDARFFGKAVSLFGLDPARCVYVGNDLRDDVAGAKGAGMRTVYMQTEQSGVYANPPSPDFAVSNVKELAETLLALLSE